MIALEKMKKLELVALKLDFSCGQSLTVAEFHRSSLASFVDGSNTVDSLNLDWLTSSSDGLKSVCDSLNLSQLINLSTHLNAKNPAK